MRVLTVLTLVRELQGQPGTSHFILELTAAHANEMGALTVVFLASLASAGLPRTAQAPEPLRRHAERISGCKKKQRFVLGTLPKAVKSKV